jgi:peroxiredoxin
VLVGPETEEHALELMEKTKSTIPLLYDLDGGVIESYRLAFDVPQFIQDAYMANGLDLGAANPNVPWRLPIPATYVVGTEQVIKERYINANFTKRMEPAAVLAAVQRVAGA